jgi:predicted SprT family Zn-dependent metalloprotease
MDKILLLSPDLRKDVEDEVRRCLDIAEREYGQKFTMPDIRFDIKNTDGGRALPSHWVLRFNLILLVENRDKFLKTTVPHEVAHLVNHKVHKPAEGKKRLMPHGQEWKKVMGVFRVPPKRTHNYDCQSIDRSKKRKQQKLNTLSRVERLLKTIKKLTDTEKRELLTNLREMA